MHRKYITFMRIVHTGIVNFIRNASLAIAAMAVMIVTLTIVLFSLVANATFGNTIQQITNKINVSVYLQDSVTPAQTKQLVNDLQKQPNVKSVEYLSKDQVLKQYVSQNANNVTLQQAINETSNPLPATIHVYLKDLNQIKSVETYLLKSDKKKLQTSDSPSYSGNLKEAIDNISHATNILRKIGIIAVGIFALVSALIIFNTIQMAIFNRRDEIQIMRLLGASTGYIRGPFIVESAIYGLLSAVVSVLIINSVFVAASSTLQASSLGLLDIGYATTYFDSHFWKFLGLQVAIGMLIGTISSVIATRRYLKFKTK
ncbi:MAG TPA: permease-like cell division protein FtsX [Candidatus Microsaccharimonas sp.]|nr:permease-like cell division protein FtsX [Candidatus Microsaccharimonas sp.]